VKSVRLRWAELVSLIQETRNEHRILLGKVITWKAKKEMGLAYAGTQSGGV
jgi:hypothetical protein